MTSLVAETIKIRLREEYPAFWALLDAAEHETEFPDFPKIPKRPSIDQSMLDTAEVWSRRSTCSRLSVGAVLARDGRVLSCGYNGAPAGLDHCQHEDDESCKVSVHAEANALISAGRFGASTDGATLYLTHAPCLACSGLLINAGIKMVVYAKPYRNTDGILNLTDAGIEVHQTAEVTF